MRGHWETELIRLVEEKTGKIVRATKRARCVGCGSICRQEFMLALPRRREKFCGLCVGMVCATGLPPEAAEWSPKEVSDKLLGSVDDRLQGLSACFACGLKWGEHNAWYPKPFVSLHPLARSKDVFRCVLACVRFPGDTREEGMVRLLASAYVSAILDEGEMWGVMQKISSERSLPAIAGAIEMVGISGMSLSEKTAWLCTFKDHPDPRVLKEVEKTLAKLGIASLEEAEENAKLQPLIKEMVDIFSATELKALIGVVRKVTGKEIPGTTKEAIATGLARFFGREEGGRCFYNDLTPALKKVVNYLLWQRHPVAVEEVQANTGIAVVVKEKRSYYGERYKLKREFAGILVCEYPYYGPGTTTIHLHPWFRERLKPVLPVPKKARFEGRNEPPAFPEGRVVCTDRAFTSAFPALDAMCHQGTIQRKKNGRPTVAGLRAVRRAGGDFEEFYPWEQKYRYKRAELLVRLADAAPDVVTPRTKPVDVLRAWLDTLTRMPDPPKKKSRRKPWTSTRFHLVSFMENLKGVSNLLLGETDTAKTCLTSLDTVLRALPPGQWITMQDIFDFIRYNDLDLPIPGDCSDAYARMPSKWGGYTHTPVEEQPWLLWERPLVQSLFLVLAAVGAVDAVFIPPESDSDVVNCNLSPVCANGLAAVRLTPIGEWYFQGGPEDCFEKLVEGEVILDERRLIIRLTGSNPVLQVALDQVSQPLGGGFYRIDGGSFLRDCDSKDMVERKVTALRSLLPDTLPDVWKEFLDNLLERINPLKPVRFTVLEVGESRELRRLLFADSSLKKLFVPAEGGRILVKASDRPKLKKRLRGLGYFIDSF